MKMGPPQVDLGDAVAHGVARHHHDDSKLPEKSSMPIRAIGFSPTPKPWPRKLTAGKIPAEKIAETQRLIFNQRLDAAVTGVLPP